MSAHRSAASDTVRVVSELRADKPHFHWNKACLRYLQGKSTLSELYSMHYLLESAFLHSCRVEDILWQNQWLHLRWWRFVISSTSSMSWIWIFLAGLLDISAIYSTSLHFFEGIVIYCLKNLNWQLIKAARPFVETLFFGSTAPTPVWMINGQSTIMLSCLTSRGLGTVPILMRDNPPTSFKKVWKGKCSKSNKLSASAKWRNSLFWLLMHKPA